MAIDNFIPEVFANEILLALRKVSTGIGLCTTKYEGLIKNLGDKVHIPTPTSLAVRPYTGADITFDTPDDSRTTLEIDTAKYIAGFIKATAQSVSPFDLANTYLEDGKYQLSDAADQVILRNMGENAHADNTISTVVLTAANIITKIREARTLLSKSGVPTNADLFMCLTPDEIAFLLDSSSFTKATEMSDSTLISGQVGKLYGFRIIETMNPYTQLQAEVTTGNPVHKLLPFGQVGATAYASAIPWEQAKVLEPENNFGTKFKALHYYGVKVIRPKALGVIKVDTGIDGTL